MRFNAKSPGKGKHAPIAADEAHTFPAQRGAMQIAESGEVERIPGTDGGIPVTVENPGGILNHGLVERHEPENILDPTEFSESALDLAMSEGRIAIPLVQGGYQLWLEVAGDKEVSSKGRFRK